MNYSIDKYGHFENIIKIKTSTIKPTSIKIQKLELCNECILGAKLDCQSFALGFIVQIKWYHKYIQCMGDKWDFKQTMHKQFASVKFIRLCVAQILSADIFICYSYAHRIFVCQHLIFKNPRWRNLIFGTIWHDDKVCLKWRAWRLWYSYIAPINFDFGPVVTTVIRFRTRN